MRRNSTLKDKSASGITAGKSLGNLFKMRKTQDINVVELDPNVTGGLQQSQSDDPELLSALTV